MLRHKFFHRAKKVAVTEDMLRSKKKKPDEKEKKSEKKDKKEEKDEKKDDKSKDEDIAESSVAEGKNQEVSISTKMCVLIFYCFTIFKTKTKKIRVISKQLTMYRCIIDM